ncbi:tetratricopeptide repeat protein [Winogradskyella sp. SYSU M77433]|uniref:tetratricopeptide repeat-containing sensor histidine kinase n=1 Tax=Winogradskyella sp. SYSU M77433 TaxID=3042722 RepID=UPI002480E542|nr:tetratricopeptide repeat protein [Winogradskyella sp. SYSU M77433]MDH7914231.1 tetratricopeptide repeat protein [Winogradskyella sp. SYSU M77433]
MKRHLPLLFLFATFLCQSQNSIIDSLKLELRHKTEDNIERLKTLNHLANYAHLETPEEGVNYSNKAIYLAKKLGEKKEEALAYRYKAYNLTELAKDSLAIEAYNSAIAILNSEKQWIDVGKFEFNKGLLYFNKSDFSNAMTCYDKALNIFETEKDSLLMAIVLNGIGTSQMYLTKYPEAINTYLKASSTYERIGKSDTDRHAEVITNLGILYSRLEKYNLALNYYNRGLKIYEESNNSFGRANTLTNIGNAYDNLKKSELAIENYEKALEIMTKLNHKYGIASALVNIGIANITLKNYDKALSYLLRSKKLFEDLENTFNLAIVYENIGLTYLESANSDNSKLQKAKFYLEQAMDYVNAIDNLKSKASILEKLAEVNVQLNNYKSAYFNLNESQKTKATYLSIEKKEEIAKLESKFEYEKKEAELTALHDKEQAIKETEILRQRSIKNASVIGGSGVITAAVIGFVLYRRKRNAVLKSKEAEFNAKVSDTELKALRSQMNPHFIFNSLNSIGDYILKNDTQAASDYLSKFAKLMRMTLENSEKKEILLSEDITLLKTYMDIERKRFNNKFNYTIDIETSLDPDDILVPPMILQPFIENSIIHGLALKDEGHITISFKAQNNMLICSVDDNGIGREKSSSSSTHKKSLGMAITKSRIEIINKIKNTKGDIKIIDKTKGTKIEVSLPMQLAY